jgi:hypothetical protein
LIEAKSYKKYHNKSLYLKCINKNIKNELQNIILRDGPVGSSSKFKQVQYFLTKNSTPSQGIERQEYYKGEED